LIFAGGIAFFIFKLFVFFGSLFTGGGQEEEGEEN
jgi:hypothetical protein